jgi:hypothetical protein
MSVDASSRKAFFNRRLGAERPTVLRIQPRDADASAYSSSDAGRAVTRLSLWYRSRRLAPRSSVQTVIVLRSPPRAAAATARLSASRRERFVTQLLELGIALPFGPPNRPRNTCNESRGQDTSLTLRQWPARERTHIGVPGGARGRRTSSERPIHGRPPSHDEALAHTRRLHPSSALGRDRTGYADTSCAKRPCLGSGKRPLLQFRSSPRRRPSPHRSRLPPSSSHARAQAYASTARRADQAGRWPVRVQSVRTSCDGNVSGRHRRDLTRCHHVRTSATCDDLSAWNACRVT